MRRNWFLAAIVIGIVSIAIAALVMRLTEEEPTAAEWADSACSSLADWKASITSLTDVSGDELTQETLSEKLDAARVATSTLVAELQGLDRPDIEAGGEVKEQLQAATAELESSFETLEEGAEEAAEADSAAEFLQALAALAPDFQALLDSASSMISDLQESDVLADARTELEQAFADAPACAELQGES